MTSDPEDEVDVAEEEEDEPTYTDSVELSVLLDDLSEDVFEVEPESDFEADDVVHQTEEQLQPPSPDERVEEGEPEPVVSETPSATEPERQDVIVTEEPAMPAAPPLEKEVPIVADGRDRVVQDPEDRAFELHLETWEWTAERELALDEALGRLGDLPSATLGRRLERAVLALQEKHAAHALQEVAAVRKELPRLLRRWDKAPFTNSGAFNEGMSRIRDGLNLYAEVADLVDNVANGGSTDVPADLALARRLLEQSHRFLTHARADLIAARPAAPVEEEEEEAADEESAE